MKILIICGDHKRNYNFIEHLQKLDNIEISKILLYSREEVVPVAPDNLNSNLKKLWQLHFEKRLEAENRRFNFNLSENQSTYIPLGELHRLSNLGKEILEIIEVQTGSYLGEDDIIRFEDQYGREVN